MRRRPTCAALSSGCSCSMHRPSSVISRVSSSDYILWNSKAANFGNRAARLASVPLCQSIAVRSWEPDALVCGRHTIVRSRSNGATSVREMAPATPPATKRCIIVVGGVKHNLQQHKMGMRLAVRPAYQVRLHVSSHTGLL